MEEEDEEEQQLSARWMVDDARWLWTEKGGGRGVKEEGTERVGSGLPFPRCPLRSSIRGREAAEEEESATNDDGDAGEEEGRVEVEEVGRTERRKADMEKEEGRGGQEGAAAARARHCVRISDGAGSASSVG